MPHLTHKLYDLIYKILR